MRKVQVIQSDKKEEQVPLHILAIEFKKLCKAGEELAASRLKQKTVLILLSHMTGLPQRDIKTVLEALPQIEKEFLK